MDETATLRNATTYTWIHPLGDIISSLLAAGLSLGLVSRARRGDMPHVQDIDAGYRGAVALAGSTLAAACVFATGSPPRVTELTLRTVSRSSLPRVSDHCNATYPLADAPKLQKGGWPTSGRAASARTVARRDKVAAANNAGWCAAVCRAHGLPMEQRQGLLFCPLETPRLYPNLSRSNRPIARTIKSILLQNFREMSPLSSVLRTASIACLSTILVLNPSLRRVGYGKIRNRESQTRPVSSGSV